MTPRERKGILVGKGIAMHEIAAQLNCSTQRVSEVVRGRFVFETPKTRKIKALIAERCGMDVAVLWPDEESLATPAAGAA